ncbi:MAG: 3-hydroxybutyryl-CoA dehydrogenase [Chloroflexi bacterium]|nr:MAG: 3-hydroxybutyryl-CoA dehydrogenase [Chloroflexota bacterium]
MSAADVKTIAVTGVGVMGAVIAQVYALSGYSVRMHDLSAARLDWAWDRIENHRFGVKRAVEIGRLSRDDADAALERLTATTDLEEATSGVDFVLEAVFEDFGLKVDVFKAVDRLAPPHAILTSNTAGLSIAALAHATNRPSQVMGWHWFQPASVMKLAELVVHDGVAPETVATVEAMARRCGKNPVVVKDDIYHWGFVANRIYGAVRREARDIVAQGIATREQVDQIMKDGFRWPMGPFEGIE